MWNLLRRGGIPTPLVTIAGLASPVLLGAGGGALISILAGGDASFFLGALFAIAGGMFVSFTMRAAWLGPLFNVPPRTITQEESTDLFGRGFTRAVFVGLFGVGLMFGGQVSSPGFPLLAGAAGVIVLLITRDST